MEKLRKLFLWLGLTSTSHKLLVTVDAVVGLEFLATTLADKHMATELPNFVLVRRWQRLESLVTHITGVNPLSLVLCPPY